MVTKKQRASNRRNAQKSTGPKTAVGKNRAKFNALKHGLTAEQITVFDERPEDFENFHLGLVAALTPIGALEEQLVERIAVCAWRLRRVYRIEANLFAASEVAVIEEDPRTDEFVPELPQLSIEDLAALNDLSQEISQPGLPKIEMTIEKFRALNAFAEITNESVARQRELATVQKKHPVIVNKAISIASVFRSLATSHGPFVQLSRHETTIERSYHRALHDLERLQARRKGEAVMAPVVLDVSSDD